VEEATVLRSNGCETIEADRDRLTWYASARLGNSSDLTLGRCTVKPGCENPRHSHPNCSEAPVAGE